MAPTPMDPIINYLSNQCVGYTMQYDKTLDKGEITFWLGDKKNTFSYQTGVWEDKTEYIINALRKMMRINIFDHLNY